MHSARTTSALLAACLRDPALAPAVAPADVPLGVERALLVGLRAGGVACAVEDGRPVVTVDAREVPDAEAVAALGAALAAPALAALADEGEALLRGRGRPGPPSPVAIAELGALTLWRRELAEGRRRIGTSDALWRAAVAEIAALEAAQSGDADRARRAMDRAARFLADAATTATAARGAA